MVKALEEVAEEEQKVLLEEEKAAEKLAQEKKKDTTISEVETPRSESKDINNKEYQSEDNEDKADKTSQPKDSYGLDTIMFGNATIRSKNNGTHSPLIGERKFANLITIEEDKNETQTSNYVENASE